MTPWWKRGFSLFFASIALNGNWASADSSHSQPVTGPPRERPIQVLAGPKTTEELTGGVRITTSFEAERMPEEFPERSCLGALIARDKDSEGCHYLLVTAAHCFELTHKGLEWRRKVTRLGPFGQVKDAKISVWKGYSKEKAGKEGDLAVVRFTADCEADAAEQIPVWPLPEKGELKDGIKPGEVLLLAGSASFMPGIVRKMNDVQAPLHFLDTRLLKAGLEKKGLKYEEPSFGDSGAAVLHKNKVIGVGIAIPKDRDFGGMVVFVGEAVTSWLNEQKDLFEASRLDAKKPKP